MSATHAWTCKAVLTTWSCLTNLTQCFETDIPMLAKWMSCLYWVKSYNQKTFFFRKKLRFCSLEAKPLISGQIGWQLNARAKWLSNALNFGALALLVPELFADLSKNVERAKFELWSPLITWPLTCPTNYRSSFVIISNAFLMQLTACRSLTQNGT